MCAWHRIISTLSSPHQQCLCIFFYSLSLSFPARRALSLLLALVLFLQARERGRVLFYFSRRSIKPYALALSSQLCESECVRLCLCECAASEIGERLISGTNSRWNVYKRERGLYSCRRRSVFSSLSRREEERENYKHGHQRG